MDRAAQGIPAPEPTAKNAPAREVQPRHYGDRISKPPESRAWPLSRPEFLQRLFDKARLDQLGKFSTGAQYASGLVERCQSLEAVHAEAAVFRPSLDIVDKMFPDRTQRLIFRLGG